MLAQSFQDTLHLRFDKEAGRHCKSADTRGIHVEGVVFGLRGAALLQIILSHAKHGRPGGWADALVAEDGFH